MAEYSSSFVIDNKTRKTRPVKTDLLVLSDQENKVNSKGSIKKHNVENLKDFSSYSLLDDFAGSLTDFITFYEAQTAKLTLRLDTDYTATANITANFTIKACGGVISDGGSYSITINGKIEDTELQFLGSTANVTLGSSNTIVKPEWFGASGDGVTDDAEALQSCLDVAQQSEKIILLAAKTYCIGSGLTISNTQDVALPALKILGTDLGATKIEAIANSITILTIDSSNRTTSASPFSRHGYIKNIEFTKDAGNSSVNAINVQACWFYSFENLKFSVDLSGIIFDGDNSANPDWTASVACRVIQCDFQSCDYGIYSKYNNCSPKLRVMESAFIACDYAGFYGNSSFLVLDNNSFAYTGTNNAGSALGAIIIEDMTGSWATYNSKQIKITSNEIDTNYPLSIDIELGFNPLIYSNNIQYQSDVNTAITTLPTELIKIGGDGANDKVVNCKIDTNWIGVDNEASATGTTSFIKAYDGAYSTKISNLTYNISYVTLGTDVFVFEETDKSTGNHTAADKRPYYATHDFPLGNNSLNSTILSAINSKWVYTWPDIQAVDYAFSIPDDDFVTIDAPFPYDLSSSYAYGQLAFTFNGNNSNTGIIGYRATASPACYFTSVTPASTEVTTGALTGTTGTDGKFTFSAHSDGKIYIENRLGSAYRVYVKLLINPSLYKS